MPGEHERSWLKAIGKKLRDDLGDSPTLPTELVELLNRIKQSRSSGQGDQSTRGRKSNSHE